MQRTTVFSHFRGLLRSGKACLEISAIRNVWAAAGRAIVQRKMALVWSRTAMVPSGWVESRPFPCLFEHRVRSLCACERLRTIAVVFYLFCCLALSLSVFLASKRERCWGMWRRWIWGLRQTSLFGRARSAWHSPREGSIVSRQLHVSRQNRRECRWRIKPTRDRVFVHGQLRCSCNSWLEDLHCSDSRASR